LSSLFAPYTVCPYPLKSRFFQRYRLGTDNAVFPHDKSSLSPRDLPLSPPERRLMADFFYPPWNANPYCDGPYDHNDARKNPPHLCVRTRLSLFLEVEPVFTPFAIFWSFYCTLLGPSHPWYTESSFRLRSRPLLSLRYPSAIKGLFFAPVPSFSSATFPPADTLMDRALRLKDTGNSRLDLGLPYSMTLLSQRIFVIF